MMARFRDAMTLAMKVKLAKLVNARLAEARRVRDGRADQVKAEFGKVAAVRGEPMISEAAARIVWGL